MSQTIQSIRGTHDVLPEQIPYWQYFEDVIRRLMRSYSYEEIRIPILENIDLFKRSIGISTDIVEKEMFILRDYGTDMALRPEGTAGCVRACLEHDLLRGQTPRLWYMGPMFRHERPQKGRYRQFHQLGVEAFGFEGPDIEAEMISMTARLWHSIGLDGVELQINSLGSVDCRARYRKKLVEYMSDYFTDLDSDSRRRLNTNPLRILDSKNPDMQNLINNAPKLTEFLDDESFQHFELLKNLLDSLCIKYVVNTRLVRGLDYYGKTVFEWVAKKLGAQNAVCAGGRFDGLVGHLGGSPTRAAGFAVGMERVVSLMASEKIKTGKGVPNAYLVMVGDQALQQGHMLAETLRDELSGLSLRINCGGGNFKSQLKRADKSGAELALILGEQEVAEGKIAIKHLRKDMPQDTIMQSSLKEYLARVIC